MHTGNSQSRDLCFYKNIARLLCVRSMGVFDLLVELNKHYSWVIMVDSSLLLAQKTSKFLVDERMVESFTHPHQVMKIIGSLTMKCWCVCSMWFYKWNVHLITQCEFNPFIARRSEMPISCKRHSSSRAPTGVGSCASCCLLCIHIPGTDRVIWRWCNVEVALN